MSESARTVGSPTRKARVFHRAARDEPRRELGILLLVGEEVGNAAARPFVVSRLPIAQQARALTIPEWRGSAECEKERQPAHGAIHEIDAVDPVGNAYVDVQAAEQIAPSDDLKAFHDIVVARVLGDFLLAPCGQWMRSRRDQAQAVFGGDGADDAATAFDVADRIRHRFEHRRDELELTLQQLVLDDILAERLLRILDQASRQFRGDVAAAAMTDEEFFFDAKGELGAAGQRSSLRDSCARSSCEEATIGSDICVIYSSVGRLTTGEENRR